MNLLNALIEKSMVCSETNNIALNELDKIVSKISTRIKRKFLPKTQRPHIRTESEYFDYVIKNYACQILISEEIQKEIQKMIVSHKLNPRIFLQNLRNHQRRKK